MNHTPLLITGYLKFLQIENVIRWLGKGGFAIIAALNNVLWLSGQDVAGESGPIDVPKSSFCNLTVEPSRAATYRTAKRHNTFQCRLGRLVISHLLHSMMRTTQNQDYQQEKPRRMGKLRTASGFHFSKARNLTLVLLALADLTDFHTPYLFALRKASESLNCSSNFSLFER